MNMIIYHIRLKYTDSDVMGYAKIKKNKVILKEPISVVVDPHLGVFCKDALLLSKDNSIVLSKDDILFMNEANETGSEYYLAFKEEVSRRRAILKRNKDTGMSDEELEDVFDDMIQAKLSTKH